MSFHNDRTTGGKSRSGIAAGHRKRERKIASAENRHWPERYQHPTKIRFRNWFAFRLSSIDTRVDPRSFLDQICKHSELIDRTGAFSPQAIYRELRLLMAHFNQFVAQLLDEFSTPTQNHPPSFAPPLPTARTPI